MDGGLVVADVGKDRGALRDGVLVAGDLVPVRRRVAAGDAVGAAPVLWPCDPHGGHLAGCGNRSHRLSRSTARGLARPCQGCERGDRQDEGKGAPHYRPPPNGYLGRTLPPQQSTARLAGRRSRECDVAYIKTR